MILCFVLSYSQNHLNVVCLVKLHDGNVGVYHIRHVFDMKYLSSINISFFFVFSYSQNHLNVAWLVPMKHINETIDYLKINCKCRSYTISNFTVLMSVITIFAYV